MMKRFSLKFLVFCFLLALVFACSNGDLESYLPGPGNGTETEQPGPEPGDGGDEAEDGKKPQDPKPDDEEEEEAASEPKAELLSAKVVSETEIVFEFSAAVRLQSLAFETCKELKSVEEGNTLTLFLEEELKPGLRFSVELEVEDEWENLINLQIPLISVNNRLPKLLINELRTEWSNTSTSKRAEFIEFRMLSEGNLGGLRVFAASNRINPLIYEFKPIEVREGEYVVLHMRTLESSSKNEYGDDLDESGGRDSSPTARDLWIPGSTKLLRKTDAVYVLDLNDQVLDAVMIAERPDSPWPNSSLIAAAEFLFEQGAWVSAAGGVSSPADAVSSAAIGSALTRSISRDEAAENTRTAADWFVTGNNGVTPGLPNIPRP